MSSQFLQRFRGTKTNRKSTIGKHYTNLQRDTMSDLLLLRIRAKRLTIQFGRAQQCEILIASQTLYRSKAKFDLEHNAKRNKHFFLAQIQAHIPPISKGFGNWSNSKSNNWLNLMGKEKNQVEMGPPCSPPSSRLDRPVILACGFLKKISNLKCGAR